MFKAALSAPSLPFTSLQVLLVLFLALLRSSLKRRAATLVDATRPHVTCIFYNTQPSSDPPYATIMSLRERVHRSQTRYNVASRGGRVLRPVESPLNECFDCGVRWGGGPGAGVPGCRGAVVQGRRARRGRKRVR